MAITDYTTGTAVRRELADVEDRLDSLQRELRREQKEVVEARRAGTAVLSAVEAAMAPLMVKLAAARKAFAEEADLATVEFVEDDEQSSKSFAAEIRHLQLDIKHYQARAELLQVEERHRANELSRLRSELAIATEQLSYEQQSVRHHQVVQQLGLENGGGILAGGPAGVGRRTMEVQAEKKLRESAEQRTGRLANQVTWLAMDTAMQHSTIQQLNKRLHQVRQSRQETSKRLSRTALASSDLHAKLSSPPKDAAGPADALRSAGDPESGEQSCQQEQPNGAQVEGEDASAGCSGKAVVGEPDAAQDTGAGQRSPLELARRRKKGTKSTGKLPQLSF